MTTFSELVDDVVTQIGRPNLRTRTIKILNNLIYELHYTTQRGVILYTKNMVEEQVTTTVDQVFAYSTPKRFQRFMAVRYDSILDYKGKYTYAKEVRPGRIMNDEKYYYYRNSAGHTMVNCGGIGSIISLAYFRRLAPLEYYAEAARPATYDSAAETWTYLSAPADEAEALAYQESVSNWMLLEHEAVLLEGALAALWKEAGDGRSQATYSRYQTLRDGMVTEEQVQLT